jgi:hypothetical protein
VPHDPRIAEQARHVARAHARDGVDLEAAEGAPEVLPLPEDRDPGEPGLEALEAELLEEPAVVRHGEAPLAVVVGEVGRLGAGPRAARHAVVAAQHAGGESQGHERAR